MVGCGAVPLVPFASPPARTLGIMRVLVAMSGGVDSSVAAGLLRDAGHQVVGVTLKLWGGEAGSGCCSVSDVDDARRVADQLGIDHHVFHFGEIFDETVVEPYVAGHAQGSTPNPCVECNRHVKFGALLERALRLGFDALATGHHARVLGTRDGPRLARGEDAAKDQSYVLAMLGAAQLARLVLPVGELTKAEVRALAASWDLRTAAKPDSQDVCFISSHQGRGAFLGARVPLHSGELVDAGTGEVLGTVPAVELVTLGQRRGLADGRGGDRRYAVAVDVPNRRVALGSAAQATARSIPVQQCTWVADPPGQAAEVLAQTSAHGPALPATFDGDIVWFADPHRLVAPGQTVAFYDQAHPDVVVGSAVVALVPPNAVPAPPSPGTPGTRESPGTPGTPVALGSTSPATAGPSRQRERPEGAELARAALCAATSAR